MERSHEFDNPNPDEGWKCLSVRLSEVPEPLDFDSAPFGRTLTFLQRSDSLGSRDRLSVGRTPALPGNVSLKFYRVFWAGGVQLHSVHQTKGARYKPIDASSSLSAQRLRFFSWWRISLILNGMLLLPYRIRLLVCVRIEIICQNSSWLFQFRIVFQNLTGFFQLGQ